MKYRKFSDLGWNVSEIELGCWGIGGNWDDVKDDEAKKVLYKIFIVVINFFDMYIYNMRSYEILIIKPYEY